MVGYLRFGQCFGSVIVSQCRKAFRRNSSIHSGSFFFATITRIVSSVIPRGIMSDSISVTKPYLYSCLLKSSAVLIGLNSIVSLLGSLDLMQSRVDICFRSQQLRKGDISQCVIDDLVQLHDDGPNAAVAGVDAGIEHACVALAV